MLSVSDSEVQKLKVRVTELESEISEREHDLKRYRDELAMANSQLEQLIFQIQQELKITQKIQQTLVPTEFPSFPGFEMSYKFVASKIKGGDYYDLFEHKDKLRFGVIVASASGHSMSAILLTVLLKLTHQMESKEGAKPHEILQKILVELKGTVGSTDQADIFYGFVDRRSYSLSYSVLGNINVFLKDGQSKSLRALSSGLGPINKEFTSAIETKSVTLNPSDMLAIVTRGITEAESQTGEAFGVERLTEALLGKENQGVHQVRNHIFHSCQQFSQGVEVERDQTVLIMEVKDKVIRLA